MNTSQPPAPDMRSGWQRPVAAIVVGLVAMTVVGPGLSGRDLTGDELGILTGMPMDILRQSWGPEEQFSGHMPWSYWLRWVSLGLFDATDAAPWRLHAAFAFVASAVALVWIPMRTGWGLVAGLLLALSPFAGFHGQESSNYAWSVLMGSVVLFAVAAPERRRWWLVVGLVLAMLNDVYSLWLVLGALVACAHVERSEWARLSKAWLGVGVAAIPLGVLVMMRLWLAGDAGGLGSHADVASADLSVWEDLLRRLQRFGGASLSGYASGRETDLWEQVPSILLPVAIASAAIRSSHRWGRQAGWLLVGAVGSALLVGAVFLLAFDRVLPMGPRTLVGLTPALVAALAGSLASLSVVRMRWGVGLSVFVLGSATLEQQLNRSTMHTDVARLIAHSTLDGHGIVAEPRIQWRLRAAGVSSEQMTSCLESVPEDWTGLWWVSLQPMEFPLDRRICQGSDGRTDPNQEVDLEGWRVAETWTAFAPVHERNAAGFLRPVTAVRYVPGEPTASTVSPGPLTLNRSALDGMGDGTVEVYQTLDSGWEVNLAERVFDTGTQAPLPEQVPILEKVWIRVDPALPSWLPEWTIFDPYRRSAQTWGPLLMAPHMQGPQSALQASAMREPLLWVLRRLAVVALLCLLVAGRFRRSTP